MEQDIRTIYLVMCLGKCYMKKTNDYFGELYYELVDRETITKGKFTLTCYDAVRIEEFKPTVEYFLKDFLFRRHR